MTLKGKGNFIFGARDSTSRPLRGRGYWPVSEWQPAAGMSGEPLVVGRKGEWKK